MLRNSISGTRKFFRRTLGSLKSLFSGASYEKLPKSPPDKPFSGSATTAGFNINSATQKMTYQREFADQTTCGSTNNAHNKVRAQQDDTINSNTNSEKKTINKTTMDSEVANTEAYRNNKVVIVKRSKEDDFSSSNNGEECYSGETGTVKKYESVEQKLKELEMLDISNVDHVLDIEEVLHYYSRLTCPAYVEIVDNFFVEIFAEFFGPPGPLRSINSGLRRNTTKI